MSWVRARDRSVLAGVGTSGVVKAVAAAAVLSAAMAAPAFAVSSPWSDHEVLQVRLVAGGAEGGKALLGLHFRLSPEWHVYWKHPGDAGAAPVVELTLDGGPSPGLLPSELAFPAPQRFELPGGLEALGYHGEVVYPVLADVAGDRRGRLRASVDYVACAVECIPFHDDLQLVLDGAADGGADEDLLRQWIARVPRGQGEIGLDVRLRYRTEPQPEIEVELAGPPLRGADPQLFLVPPAGATFGRAERSRRADGVLFRAPVVPETIGPPPESLRVVWTVTGLRDQGSAVASQGQADVPATTAAASREQDSGATRGPATAAARAPTLIAALSLLPLLLAVLAWTAPGREARVGTPRPTPMSSLLAMPDPLLRGLGFLAAGALVWSSYRLATLLPAAQLAGVQLSWLAVALAVHSATRNRGWRRVVWCILAVAGAALAVWLA